MEVVNEFYFMAVGHQEVADCTGLWLREWEWAAVVLGAWVWAVAAWLRPRDSVVAIQVHSQGVGLAIALASVRVSVFANEQDFTCLQKVV